MFVIGIIFILMPGCYLIEMLWNIFFHVDHDWNIYSHVDHLWNMYLYVVNLWNIYLPGSCKQSLQWFSIGVSQSPIYIYKGVSQSPICMVREFPNHLYVWYALCLVDLLMVMMIARRWRWCSPWWKHPNRRWLRCAGCWRPRCSTGKGSGRTGSSWTSCLWPINQSINQSINY